MLFVVLQEFNGRLEMGHGGALFFSDIALHEARARLMLCVCACVCVFAVCNPYATALHHSSQYPFLFNRPQERNTTDRQSRLIAYNPQQQKIFHLVFHME